MSHGPPSHVRSDCLDSAMREEAPAIPVGLVSPGPTCTYGLQWECCIHEKLPTGNPSSTPLAPRPLYRTLPVYAHTTSPVHPTTVVGKDPLPTPMMIS